MAEAGTRRAALAGLLANRRVAAAMTTGFASGLPFNLPQGTLQSWLSTTSVDLKTIGVFTLVAVPYSVKWLWAPLLDRYAMPFLGRRRGWIALHGSMAERTGRTLGEPDLVILADGGRVLFVECKSRRGKLSPTALPDDAEPSKGEIEDCLIALERSTGRNRFRAVRALCRFADNSVQITRSARESLSAHAGDRLHTIPFES